MSATSGKSPIDDMRNSATRGDEGPTMNPIMLAPLSAQLSRAAWMLVMIEQADGDTRPDDLNDAQRAARALALERALATVTEVAATIAASSGEHAVAARRRGERPRTGRSTRQGGPT